MLRRLLRNRSGMVGLVLCTAFVLLAIMAPLLAPYDPLTTDWARYVSPPHPVTGLAQTTSVATFCRVLSGDRAPR
jgi:ABC-type antimicrobial peptide transport system permease subunit